MVRAHPLRNERRRHAQISLVLGAEAEIAELVGSTDLIDQPGVRRLPGGSTQAVAGQELGRVDDFLAVPVDGIAESARHEDVLEPALELDDGGRRSLLEHRRPLGLAHLVALEVIRIADERGRGWR